MVYFWFKFGFWEKEVGSVSYYVRAAVVRCAQVLIIKTENLYTECYCSAAAWAGHLWAGRLGRTLRPTLLTEALSLQHTSKAFKIIILGSCNINSLNDSTYSMAISQPSNYFKGLRGVMCVAKTCRNISGARGTSGSIGEKKEASPVAADSADCLRKMTPLDQKLLL